MTLSRQKESIKRRVANMWKWLLLISLLFLLGLAQAIGFSSGTGMSSSGFSSGSGMSSSVTGSSHLLHEGDSGRSDHDDLQSPSSAH